MNILILGANGKIARQAIALYLENTENHLTLYLRDSKRISDFASERVSIVEGDVLDTNHLKKAMQNQDIVYANLAGEMEAQAKSIIEAMNGAKVKRLIFVATLGIYNEVPGEFGKWNNKAIGQYLPTYRKAANLIEQSDLDYTILRPAWLTDYDEINYEITARNENFKGTEVSRKSIADLVVKISQNPALYSKDSIGVNKPDTSGSKPAFI